MKITEVRKQTDEQLQTLLASQQQELSQMNLEMHTKELKQVRKLRVLKKTIARILSVIQERALAIEQEAK